MWTLFYDLSLGRHDRVAISRERERELEKVKSKKTEKLNFKLYTMIRFYHRVLASPVRK